jgi:hypothetical protein
VGGPALRHSRPLIRQLVTFGQHARPVTGYLDKLSANLDKSGGIERILDYIFYQGTAINGFDGVGHYLRAELLTNLCSQYTVKPATGCNANFTTTHPIQPAGSRAKPDPSLAKLRKKLEESALAGVGGSSKGARATPTDPFAAISQLVNPQVSRLRNNAVNRIRRGVGRGRSPAFGRQTATEAALDYLLGSSP